VVDLSPESTDPCKEFLDAYKNCAKDKSRDEKMRDCLHLGATFYECKINPNFFKEREKKKA